MNHIPSLKKILRTFLNGINFSHRERIAHGTSEKGTSLPLFSPAKPRDVSRIEIIPKARRKFRSKPTIHPAELQLEKVSRARECSKNDEARAPISARHAPHVTSVIRGAHSRNFRVTLLSPPASPPSPADPTSLFRGEYLAY